MALYKGQNEDSRDAARGYVVGGADDKAPLVTLKPAVRNENHGVNSWFEPSNPLDRLLDRLPATHLLHTVSNNKLHFCLEIPSDTVRRYINVNWIAFIYSRAFIQSALPLPHNYARVNHAR